MNPRKNKPFAQLPPRTPLWLDIIRLLAEYDASVHDVVHGNSLTTLNLVWHQGESRTLEFFHFLQDQCYVDFGAEKVDGWSAFTSALRSAGTSLECLKFLEARGIDFSKISADGRSLLHFGAELAHEPEVIEYLCEICPPHYINRQDDLGWTPLHYAIAFEALHMPQDSLVKVELLVRRGANPSITARHFLLVNIDKDEFTALELSETLKSDQYERFLAILMDCGHEIPEEATENVFHEIVTSEPIS
jgi:ankyrin repeat protein